MLDKRTQLNLPSVNAPSASPVPSDVQLVPVQVCLDESHKSKDECRRRKGRARRGSPINISSLFQDSKSDDFRTTLGLRVIKRTISGQL